MKLDVVVAMRCLGWAEDERLFRQTQPHTILYDVTLSCRLSFKPTACKPDSVHDLHENWLIAFPTQRLIYTTLSSLLCSLESRRLLVDAPACRRQS